MLAEPISRIVFVNDQHGLHLRPCSAIVTTVSRHQAKVTVHQGGHAVNADSIFGLLSLAATRGTELILSATGPDAQEVLEAVVRLFAEEPALAHCA